MAVRMTVILLRRLLGAYASIRCSFYISMCCFGQLIDISDWWTYDCRRKDALGNASTVAFVTCM